MQMCLSRYRDVHLLVRMSRIAGGVMYVYMYEHVCRHMVVRGVHLLS